METKVTIDKNEVYEKAIYFLREATEIVQTDYHDYVDPEVRKVLAPRERRVIMLLAEMKKAMQILRDN